ncbi:MAG: segregation/condensation protein A, partial [Eubacteriales bacterium]|nr:segregation/condensation protein A [Eubacteriales bacterium]
EEEEDEEDPREALIARLLEYKRYKFISHELRIYEDYAERYCYRDDELPEELKSYVPPVDLDELLEGVSMELLKEVYSRVIRRMSAADNSGQQQFFGVIKKHRISLTGCIETMVSFAKKHRRFSFRQMLKTGADKTEVVVSFLAVLELMRMGKVSVNQEAPDSDLDVEVNADADFDDMDLSSIEDR